MTTVKSILLACSALTAIAIAQPTFAATVQAPGLTAQPHVRAGAWIVAQTPPPATPEDAKKKAEEEEKKRGRPHPPAATKQPPGPPPAVQAKPAAPPPPPAAQAKPAVPPPPAAQEKLASPPPAPAAQAKPAAPPPPASSQAKPEQKSSDRERGRESERRRPEGRDRRDARDNKPDSKPPSAEKPAPAPAASSAQKPPAPAAEQKPAAAAAPVEQKPAASAPAEQKPAAAAPAEQKPAAAAPAAKEAAPAAAAAAPPPPTKPQDASQFLQRKGDQPSGGMEALRRDRRTTTEGNRTVIQEGNRTIVRDGNRRIIRHNEADRFSVGARDVKVDRSGDQTISLVLRPNGISIVSTTDRDGHLLRRVRRDRNGRDVVIIDNSFAGAQRGNFYVDLRPPRISRERYRDRYILNARRANRDRIYGVLLAPPIERIDRRYTLDQVRYNHPLREYMPRIDLDINFAIGSWQLSPSQVGELSVIAQGINRAIDKNPREVFLIEGHTDAVGSDEDNLSLSDRRAEAVAVALTEEFGVPPENLVTQGYGEEYLKEPTEGPSRENRRVAVRRITPLIDQVAGR